MSSSGIVWDRPNIFTHPTRREFNLPVGQAGRCELLNLLDIQSTDFPAASAVEITSATCGSYQIKISRSYITQLQWDQVTNPHQPQGVFKCIAKWNHCFKKSIVSSTVACIYWVSPTPWHSIQRL